MLTDRFCPSQLPDGFEGPVYFRPASKAEARAILLSAGSAIESPHLTKLVAIDLGIAIDRNQEALKLHPEDHLVVVKYYGPQLRPGQKHLDPGARFDYFLLDVGHPDGWRHKQA